MKIGTCQDQTIGQCDVDPIDATDNMGLMLFREATQTIAGFAAEDFLGMAHPCSSIEPRVRAAVICKHLGDPLGKPEWHFFNRSLQYCKAVITENRHALNIMTLELSRRRILTRKNALSLLKQVKCVSPDWYLYAE
jgi:hypothetical protein